MNAVSAHEMNALDLVDIIDFKWLMAREGHHVHVERLQNDPLYATECIERARRSPIEAVRLAAERLLRKLGQPPSAA
jgi:hypothetical protein